MTDSFETATVRMLSSLRQDMRDFVRVVCDDPELDQPLRELAAGAVLYGLTPGDIIPDSSSPPLGFVDDALALRVVLEIIAKEAPERFDSYCDRLPEMCETLDDDLDAAKAYLGDLYEPFVQRVRLAVNMEFKGKNAKGALEDAEWMETELAVLAVKLEFKEETVQAAARKVATLLPQFRAKLGRSKI
jgi:uncharacterized membrane protein YkvA (DUF1232 family)